MTVNKQNKKIYIGVHKTIDPNMFDGYLGCGVYVNQPSSYNKAKTNFQYAVQKYGPENFIRKTIKVFNDEEDAFFMESEIVNEEFICRPDVYNMVLGGKGGDFAQTRKTTYQYDLSGKLIKEYSSIKEAAMLVNRNMRTIWRAINEKIKSADSYWSNEKYETLDLSSYKTETIDTGFITYQYDDKGEYECCYESIVDCCRILGLDRRNMMKAMKLGILHHNKYFSYDFQPNYSIVKSEQIKNRTIYQYDLNGEYIGEFENAESAKKHFGKLGGNVYTAIKLGTICFGFQWRFEKFDKIAPYIAKKGPRKIGKYDKDWNLIKIYDTLAACKKENGSGMQHVLSGRDEFAKGFRYKYES